MSFLAHLFRGGLFSPPTLTYDPLLFLLNHDDKSERDRLTEKWKDNKLQELNFVGVVVRAFHIDHLLPLFVFLYGSSSLPHLGTLHARPDFPVLGLKLPSHSLIISSDTHTRSYITKPTSEYTPKLIPPPPGCPPRECSYLHGLVAQSSPTRHTHALAGAHLLVQRYRLRPRQCPDRRRPNHPAA